MKIIQKTINKSYENWSPNPLIRCYHYCSAFNGNKMIEFAQNNPIKMSTKAFRIGKRFNIPKYLEYPYVHGESHLISKLLDRYNTIDPNWSIVVMRINRQGLILGSKPCENCKKLLNAVGLNKVYYSIDNGNFIDYSGTLIEARGLTVPMSMV